MKPSAIMTLAGACFALAGSVFAQDADDPLPPYRPLLWKVESPGGNSHGYLFGTVHVADPRVANLPKVVTDAVTSSDVVVTELKLTPEVTAKLGAASMLPATEKRNLDEILPADVVAKCDVELGLIMPGLSVSKAPMNRMQLWALASSISTLDTMLEYPGQRIVDERIAALAKEHESIETVDEQLAVFQNFEDEEMIDLLEMTLDGMRKLREEGLGSYSEYFIMTYRRGDEKEMEDAAEWDAKLMGGEEPEISKKFKKVLLTDRNKLMAERMLARYKANPETMHFVAVGALHVVGETGLVSTLKNAGYIVTRVNAPIAEPVEAGAAK